MNGNVVNELQTKTILNNILGNIQPVKILRAVVCDVSDPLKQGRVKVYFPQLYSIKNAEINKATFPWVEPLFIGSILSNIQPSEFNKDPTRYQFTGIQYVPKIGEQVLVIVFDNDYNQLAYLPFQYFQQDTFKKDRVQLPEISKVQNRNFQGILRIQSNDHVICFYDLEQETKTQGIVLKTFKENYFYFLDKDTKNNKHIQNIKLNIQTLDIFGEYGNFLFKTQKTTLQLGKQTKTQKVETLYLKTDEIHWELYDSQKFDAIGKYGNYIFKTNKTTLQFGKQSEGQQKETLFLKTDKVRWELEETQTFRLQKFFIDLENENDDNKVVRKKDLKDLIKQIHEKIHAEIQAGLPCIGCIFGAIAQKILPPIDVPDCSNTSFTK